MIDRVKIEALLSLAAKATPGPWEAKGASLYDDIGPLLVANVNVNKKTAEALCAYIAALPPELVTHLCAVYAAAVEAEDALAGRDCYEHADNCCASWCDRCKEGDEQQANRTAALARLRGALGETKE